MNSPIVDKDAHKCNAFPVSFYHRHYTHKVKNIIVLFIIFLTKMSNVHSTLTSFLYIQYISKKKNNLKLLITGIYETTWLSIITVALQHTKETIFRKVHRIWLLSDLLEVPLPYNPDCCPSTIRPSEHHHDASRRSEIHR